MYLEVVGNSYELSPPQLHQLIDAKCILGYFVISTKSDKRDVGISARLGSMLTFNWDSTFVTTE